MSHFRNILRFLSRLAFRLVVTGLVLLVVVLGALQLPEVQTYLAQKATVYISEKLGFPVAIEQVSIRWWDVAVFKNVSITDRQQHTMIKVPALTVDFSIADLTSSKGIFLDEVVLNKPEVRLLIDEKTGDLNIDEFINAIEALTASPTPSNKKKGGNKFAIERIRLQDALFQYADLRKDSIKNAFDYVHISIRHLSGDAYRFFIAGDTVSLSAKDWTGYSEHPGWDIHNLSTDFQLTKKNMSFRSLNLQVGNSVLRDSLVFNYDQQKDMGDFVTKVRIAANLKNTRIYSKDLALFARDLLPFEDEYTLDGVFRGSVNKFRFRNFTFGFGKDSRLQGNLSMEGLPEIDGTLIKADLKPSLLVADDMRQYLNTQAYPNVQKFGTVRLDGKFQGFTNNFVANGNFETALGNFHSNVQLQLKENPAESYYKGDLSTQGFHLGKLIDQPASLGLIDLNGNIEGRGLTVATANFVLKADISRFSVLKYEYKNIAVNGKLSKESFAGDITVRDPNLAFSGNGSVNLAKNINSFDIHTNLQRADLQALGFTSEVFRIKSKVDLTFQGLDPDKISGQAQLTDAEITYKKDSLVFDSLFVRSEKDPQSLQRNFDLSCDYVKVHANGNFRYEQVYRDLAEIAEEYALSLENNRKAIRNYYETKQKLPTLHQKYKVDYAITLSDINPVMALFLPDMKWINKNATLEGYFQNGKNTTFACSGNIDTLQYSRFRFYKSNFDLNLSKSYSDARILGAVSLKSEKQELGKAAATSNLVADLTWFEDRIDFDGSIRQQGNTNLARLVGDVRFSEDRTEFRLKPVSTKLQVLDQVWKPDAGNLITVKGNTLREIEFQSVILSTNTHSLGLEGFVSEDSLKNLEVNIHEFDLAFLNSLTGLKLEGTANGKALVNDVYHRLKVLSNLDVHALTVAKVLIGNLTGKIDWDNDLQRITLNTSINRYNKEILNIYGTYDTQEKSNPLNISMVLDDTDLQILEPFTQGQVTGLAGNARGLLRLTGSFEAPSLKGTVSLRKAKFKYTYLNTTYTINDKVYFYQDRISFRNLKLTDDAGYNALVKGDLLHENFHNLRFDLTIAFKNFKVLSTTARDNSQYYGTAIVTGGAAILGTVDNLFITADARSNQGTHLFIPVGGVSEIQQEDYIIYISKKQKPVSGKKIRKISGVSLNLNLDVTPDAACEIIFDQQTGDRIKGSGTGKINMAIDTKGEFTMRGDFVIARGDYNFSFVGLVTKGFTITPGGTINWNGDPYQAILNLQARYRVMTPLTPILNYTSTDGLSDPALSRSYPVSVTLNLTNNLLAPKIDLGIEIREQDYPKSLAFLNVLAFLGRVQADEQELNRQVFSLMILQKLLPEGTFSGASVSVTSSVSELLSGELNHFVSQLDQTLEVNLNVAGNTDPTRTGNLLQVRVAKSFLNGRLRIERNGNFGDNPNQTQAQGIIGEWTIEYWVSQDGRWRVKMYNRNTQNTFTNLNTANSTMAGFSLLHTTSFNSLKDLLHHKKEEDPQPENQPETPVTGDRK